MGAKTNKKNQKRKFSKTVVVFCIAFIVFYTIIQVYLNYKLGVELSPTLTTCVYAFFGTELSACAFVRVFDKESAENN